MSYWLLDKIKWITTNQLIPASTEEYNIPYVASVSKRKTLSDISTLEKWDMIVDCDWIRRYVVDVVAWKLILTWRKATWPTSFKKVFTWTQDKINQATGERWFRLVF